MVEPIQTERVAAKQAWALAMWLLGSLSLVYMTAILPAFEAGTLTAYSGLGIMKPPYYGPGLGPLPYLATLLFLWRSRSNFNLTPVTEPSMTGIGIVVLGAMIFVAAARLQDPRVAMFSLPILWIGLGWSIGGRKVARAICFPALLLLFIIPIPGYPIAAWHTMLFVIRASHSIIDLFGVDASLRGPYIFAIDGSWEFEFNEGSSNKVITPLLLAFVAIITAKLILNRAWTQIALVATSLLFALILRIAYISIGLLLADRINPDFGSDFLHNEFVKFACFVIWITGLIVLAIWLRPSKEFSVRQHKAEPPTS